MSDQPNNSTNWRSWIVPEDGVDCIVQSNTAINAHLAPSPSQYIDMYLDEINRIDAGDSSDVPPFSDPAGHRKSLLDTIDKLHRHIAKFGDRWLKLQEVTA